MKHSGSIINVVQQTEKGTDLGAKLNQYLLKVAREANKIEIKRAVEDRFNVTVRTVNTMNIKGKKRVLRNRRTVHGSDWKRAIVTLKAGDRIDVV